MSTFCGLTVLTLSECSEETISRRNLHVHDKLSVRNFPANMSSCKLNSCVTTSNTGENSPDSGRIHKNHCQNVQISTNQPKRSLPHLYKYHNLTNTPDDTMAQYGSFRDLKELLSESELDELNTIPLEVRLRTHKLCSKFLGGAWKEILPEELRLSKMRGGMSNMLFLCRLPDGTEPKLEEPNQTLLRVYFNPETESHLVAESVIFTLLSEKHLGPRLHGIFNGGRLEEFIPSRPLTCRELRQPAISCKIAQRLAKIHQLNVPIVKDPDYIVEATESRMTKLLGCISRDESALFPIRIPIISNCSNQYASNNPEENHMMITFEQLQKEADFVRQCIMNSRSPVVFCHNDLQEGNILLPKAHSGNIRTLSSSEESQQFLAAPKIQSSPNLVIIDYEYASYNYRAFDMANHFCEWTLDYTEPQSPYYSYSPESYPDENEQNKFFESYLNVFNEGQMSSEEIGMKKDEMLKEVKAFVPVSHFFWGIWSLLQLQLSPVEFGFGEYGRDRLAMYFETKANLLALLESETDENPMKVAASLKNLDQAMKKQKQNINLR